MAGFEPTSKAEPAKVQTVSNSIFTLLPSAAAALTKVVKVKLVYSSSNNRLSETLLVCILLPSLFYRVSALTCLLIFAKQ
jgi:hypothetical protein